MSSGATVIKMLLFILVCYVLCRLVVVSLLHQQVHWRS